MTATTPRASQDLFLPRKRRFFGRGPRSISGDAGVPRYAEPGDGERRTSHDGQKLIRVTVAREGLQTVFQPIVDLQTGGTVGAEALARFNTPPLRPPDEWFAEAADVGMEVELEVAALHSALRQLRRMPSGLYLSLNASPSTMVSPEFRAVISDVAAERIVLELTEHTGIDDYDTFRQAIAEFRSKGLRLAVDDAGSGFSSFRHILNLRPDIIKLDIALTRGIDYDPARRALGSALLTFGLDAYNATVVAEGIETEGELNTLKALGCRYGQGYYLGKPAAVTMLDQARTIGPSYAAVEAAVPSAVDEAHAGPGGPRQSGSYSELLTLVAEIEESLDAGTGPGR